MNANQRSLFGTLTEANPLRHVMVILKGLFLKDLSAAEVALPLVWSVRGTQSIMWSDLRQQVILGGKVD